MLELKQRFKNNRLCKLLKIDYPILQGGMVWTSGWKLATAVSRAGGFGLIGAASMRPDLLKSHIEKAKASGVRVGVNIPVFFKHTPEFVKVVCDSGLDVVVCSAGNPKTHIADFKSAGLTIGHVVSNLKFSLKAQDAGCDFIVAEGFEAGGHNGREELTTLVLMQHLDKKLSVPLLAAGGIATGASWLAMEALGADGIQVGSRLAITQESSLHDNFKKAVQEADEKATKLILKSLMPVRAMLNEWALKTIELEAQGANKTELEAHLGQGRSRIGMFEGDLTEGELEIGQIATVIYDCPSVDEVMKRFLTQYQQSLSKLET